MFAFFRKKQKREKPETGAAEAPVKSAQTDVDGEKCRYLLFNRRVIIKELFDADGHARTFLKRDPEAHTWENAGSLFARYMHCDFDGLEEEIDYDEETEQITALRREPGCWADKGFVESYNPSELVADFLREAGIQYEDIYCAPQQEQNESYDVTDALRDFDDLTAGWAKKDSDPEK